MEKELHPCVRPRRRFVLAFLGVCLLLVLMDFAQIGTFKLDFYAVFLAELLLLALPASFTICDSITLPPHCKPNLIFYSTGYFTVKDQFVYGMLVLVCKWLLFGVAYFTWFRIIGLV